MTRSTSSSPLRKKSRLSSPTYDAHFAELDDIDFQALDDMELTLSQKRSAFVPPQKEGERSHDLIDGDEGVSRQNTDHPIMNAGFMSVTSTQNPAFEKISPQEYIAIPTPLRVERPSKHRMGHSSMAIERHTKPVQLEDHGDSGIGPLGHSEECRIHLKSSTQLPQEYTSFTTASSFSRPSVPTALFLPASLMVSTSDMDATKLRSPSPDTSPPEPDYDAWFSGSPIAMSTGDSTGMPPPGVFAPASFLKPTVPATISTLLSSGIAPEYCKDRPLPSWVIPSASAVEKARMKIEQWNNEIDSQLNLIGPDIQVVTPATILSQSQPVMAKKTATSIDREPLRDVENSSMTQEAVSVSTRDPSPPSPPARSFKMPAFIVPRSTTATTSTPSRPSSIRNSIAARSSAATSIPAPSSLSSPKTPIRPVLTTSSTPVRPMPSTTPSFPDTPLQSVSTTPFKPRALGLTPRAHAFTKSKARPRFVTPFKKGVAPAKIQPSPLSTTRMVFEATQTDIWTQTPMHVQVEVRDVSIVEGKGKGKGQDVRLPDSEPRTTKLKSQASSSNHTRTILARSGLVPQSYDVDELEIMGIDTSLFSLTTVSHFLYYRFNAPSAQIDSCVPNSTQCSLGPDTALAVLHSQGHNLATRAWVNNHWSLILWKMIGMSCLEPEKLEWRWSWREVMKQLEYRYIRELDEGHRPPLRLITTHDSTPSLPINLCISSISWSDEYVDTDGLLVPAHPELEVTDGWYRLRAKVDEPLARAARRGILKVGRKISCCCAKLESKKKDPVEILDAYDDVQLVLSGNSTHLAPWHTKLGFQRRLWVATLGSLTPDGGGVPVMDFIITKVHPVGFIEFITLPNGDIIREGPRIGKDEAVEEDRWRERRDHEVAKLRDELEKKLHKLEAYADRLERIAGSKFQPLEDESPPNHIENVADELEESEDPASFIKTLSNELAGWLSLFLRKKCEIDREKSGEEIDRELTNSFPPRHVRDFRVLHVKDAVTIRKPSIRTAQLTVWDVMSIQMTEGGNAGQFSVGQRYMVSNLIPSTQSAWMGFEEGAEVYLSTRRDSKWRLIK